MIGNNDFYKQKPIRHYYCMTKNRKESPMMLKDSKNWN